MANFVGLNINTYVVYAEDQYLNLDDPTNILNSTISLFGGGYFLANPPGYAYINGVQTVINPNYNTKLFIPSDPNDPAYDPTTNFQATYVNYGPVILTAGNGNNTLTGDMTSLSFKALSTASYDSRNNAHNNTGDDHYISQYTEFQNMRIQLGQVDTNHNVIQGNTLTTGNGNTTIYGNVHDLNMVGQVTGQAVGGQDYSYWDIYEALKGVDKEAVFLNVETDMGHNTITAGTGVKSIYGDIYSVNFDAIGSGIAPVGTNPGTPGSIGSGLSQVLLGIVGDAPVVKAGHNTIQAGTGNNTIAGDSNDISIVAKGGYDGSFADFASSFIEDVKIFDGHNSITVNGSGTNTITGGVFHVLLEADGGVADNGRNGAAIITASRTNPNGIDLQGNTITVKGSSTTTIYGSAEDVTFKAVGGTVLHDGYLFDPDGRNFDPLTHVNDKFNASAVGGITFNRVLLGQNTIDTSNDSGPVTIFGDTQTLHFEVVGGTVNGSGGRADAYIVNNRVTMGGDTIAGGSGHTEIWGNAEDVNFEFISGHNNATDPSHALVNGVMSPPPFHYSSPMVNPTLIDFSNMFQEGGVNAFARATSGNILTFNGDTITAGTGDTVIHSHVGQFENLDTFLNTLGYLDQENPASLGNNNQVIFGNDILIGNTGKDTFAFDLMNIGNVGNNPFVMQGSAAGHNEIKNFTVGQDNLEFDGITKAQFLQNVHISDVAGPNGGTVVEFGTYTKQIGTLQVYNAANDHGISALNGFAIYLDPYTNQEIVSIVNDNPSDAATNALITQIQNAGVEVVTNPQGSNISLGDNTLVSGAPYAHMDIVNSTYTLHGSLMIDNLHLSQQTGQALIQALGTAHVIFV
jgi:hypothetical protein